MPAAKSAAKKTAPKKAAPKKTAAKKVCWGKWSQIFSWTILSIHLNFEFHSNIVVFRPNLL